jgi:hypothetical protein
MSTHPIVNILLGLTDDLIGGSSLMWRYHHQVRLGFDPCFHFGGKCTEAASLSEDPDPGS